MILLHFVLDPLSILTLLFVFLNQNANGVYVPKVFGRVKPQKYLFTSETGEQHQMLRGSEKTFIDGAVAAGNNSGREDGKSLRKLVSKLGSRLRKAMCLSSSGNNRHGEGREGRPEEGLLDLNY
jgi:hypothetical protein